MKQNFLKLFLVATATLAVAQGGTLTTFGSQGPNVDVVGITGFQTFGDDMTGLVVSVNYLDGTSESCAWAITGAGSGGCGAADFRIDQSGDTFLNPWVFTSSKVTASILFDGLIAGIVFDRTEPSVGTFGSAQGKDALGDTIGDDGIAIYDTFVGIGGAAPVGDEFGYVRMLFGQRGITGARWVMDTDTVGLYAVPEPGSYALFGAGLAMIACLRRRR